MVVIGFLVDSVSQTAKSSQEGAMKTLAITSSSSDVQAASHCWPPLSALVSLQRLVVSPPTVAIHTPLLRQRRGSSKLLLRLSQVLLQLPLPRRSCLKRWSSACFVILAQSRTPLSDLWSTSLSFSWGWLLPKVSMLLFLPTVDWVAEPGSLALTRTYSTNLGLMPLRGKLALTLVSIGLQPWGFRIGVKHMAFVGEAIYRRVLWYSGPW